MGELAQHSETLVQVTEVNAADVPGSNAFLPGEILCRVIGKGSQSRRRGTIVVNSELGAGRGPFKLRNQKTRCHEGPNR
jgi:hypothetical protein